MRKIIKNSSHKGSARKTVAEALRKNKIKRLPCETCGNVKSEAHHTDYSKPLKITWLCRKHHSEWHKENGIFETTEQESLRGRSPIFIKTSLAKKLKKISEGNHRSKANQVEWWIEEAEKLAPDKA